MPSYLEIALRVVGPSQPAPDEEGLAANHPNTVPPASRFKASGEEQLALCGSPYCAGCYDIGDGRKIHPPRCGQEYQKCLESWQPQGKPQ